MEGKYPRFFILKEEYRSIYSARVLYIKINTKDSITFVSDIKDLWYNKPVIWEENIFFKTQGKYVKEISAAEAALII